MNLFLSIFKFFPYALAAVSAVETAVPVGTPGATKKQIILDSITAVTKVGEQVPVPIVSTISVLIDSIVASLNASGIFSHKAPTPAPAAPHA